MFRAHCIHGITSLELVWQSRDIITRAEQKFDRGAQNRGRSVIGMFAASVKEFRPGIFGSLSPVQKAILILLTLRTIATFLALP
jgi:hypothetical protein